MPSKNKRNNAQTQEETLTSLRNARAAYQNAADQAGDEAKIILQSPLTVFTEDDNLNIGVIGDRLKRITTSIVQKDREIGEITDNAAADTQVQIDTLDEIDAMIYKIDYRRNKFQKREESSASTDVPHAAHSSAILPQNTSFGGGDQMRLPRVDLPSFNGCYTDWTAFWDMFNATVHQNTSLNDSQRFKLLETFSQGGTI